MATKSLYCVSLRSVRRCEMDLAIHSLFRGLMRCRTIKRLSAKILHYVVVNANKPSEEQCSGHPRLRAGCVVKTVNPSIPPKHVGHEERPTIKGAKRIVPVEFPQKRAMILSLFFLRPKRGAWLIVVVVGARR